MNFYKATLKLYLSFLHKEIIWYFLLIQKNENCNLIHGKYQTKLNIYKKVNLNEGINTLNEYYLPDLNAKISKIPIIKWYRLKGRQ